MILKKMEYFLTQPVIPRRKALGAAPQACPAPLLVAPTPHLLHPTRRWQEVATRATQSLNFQQGLCNESL